MHTHTHTHYSGTMRGGAYSLFLIRKKWVAYMIPYTFVFTYTLFVCTCTCSTHHWVVQRKRENQRVGKQRRGCGYDMTTTSPRREREREREREVLAVKLYPTHICTCSEGWSIETVQAWNMRKVQRSVSPNQSPKSCMCTLCAMYVYSCTNHVHVGTCI